MQHTMEKPTFFPLHGLRLAIAATLLSPALPTLAEGLNAAPGDAAPRIEHHQGVPVVDIVAPNAQGLSHNRFTDFNVGTQGLVLNNSLSAGHTDLAGALPANAQFNGSAATTILNEVVGHSRSTLNGPQVIFGSAADYVLANPNGITLNGATLDNVQRATFVVGSAGVQDGTLAQLDTRNAKGQLRVDQGGVTNRGAGLALIAPSISSSGEIRTGGNLDLVLGGNRVDYPSSEITDSTRLPKRIDASLLGAMAADDRIRIVSSDAGAGIKMPGTRLTAGNGITVVSAGGINFAAPVRAGQSAAPAKLNAGRGELHMEAEGLLNLSSAQLSTAGNAQLRGEVIRSQGARIDSNGTLRMTADSLSNTGSSRFQGGDIAVEVNGKLVDAGTDYVSTAGKIQINADSHELKAAMDKTLEGAATTTTAKAGSLASAAGIEIRLSSNGRYEGTQFKADQGPIDIKAGGNLMLAQASELVERNSKAGTQLSRNALPVHLSTPGAIDLQSGRELQLNGVNVGSAQNKAGSLKLTAGSTLTSLAATSSQTSAGGGQSDIAGGLYQLSQTDEKSQTQAGNQWYVRDAMTLQAGSKKSRAIHLQGVQAQAQSIALDAAAGGLYFEAARNQTQLDTKQLSSGAADPAKPGVALTYRKVEGQTHQNASLKAETVNLNSKSDAVLEGARIDAKTLAGDVKGKLTVSNRTDSTQQLDVVGNAQAADRSHPLALLNEVSTMAGKWSKPGKDALALLPPGEHTTVDQATFEFSRSDKGGIAEASQVSASGANTLKVAGGTTIAADNLSFQDLSTTHRVTTQKGGLEAAKRLYEQVRIR